MMTTLRAPRATRQSRLFTAADLEAARRRTGAAPAATAIVAAMRARLDTCPRPHEIPVQAGGWMHEYVCPVHWDGLQFDPASPDRHRCPHGESHQGPVFDAAWRVYRHRQLSVTARDLALLARLGGNETDARAAVDILLGYAGHYRDYTGHHSAQPWMLTGRVFHQALTEALWAVPIVQAYDLLAPTLAAAEDDQIVTGLLRPLAETIAAAHDRLVREQGKLASNYNAWLLAALGCLGFALADEALIERALYGPGGFPAHLAAAILPDGFEHEGTPYYHNFVTLAYTILAEAARAQGHDLYAVRGPEGQSIEAMWRTLAALAWPDGSLPAANDGPYWASGPFAAEVSEAYEVALARTGEPAFAWLLNQTYHAGTPRDQWTALLYGVPDLDPAASPRRASICLESVGLAALRDTTDAAAPAVCVPFGPYGGAHGHFDRLGVQIWPWSLDPGTPPYAIAARRDWYQQTAAHNTVVVDGRSQPPAASRLLAWHPTPTGGTLWLDGDGAYPDLHVSRLLTLAGGVLTDLVTVAGGSLHTLDWLLHVDGTLVPVTKAVAPASGPLAEEDAYSFLTLHARARDLDTFTATVNHDGRRYRLTLTAGQPFELLLATAPGPAWDPATRRQVIVARVRDRHARFLAVTEEVTHA